MKENLLLRPRDAWLCYSQSSITAARTGTGYFTNWVVFMLHSKKQNHPSVKAVFLCLFSILDENKSISVSFDLLHFLTDTSRMLWVQWVSIAQQGPQVSLGNCSHTGTTRSREAK